LDLPVCVLEKRALPLEVLSSGDEVMKQLLHLIMKTPIGLGAYFAYQVGIFGLNYLVHMRSHWVFIMEFVLFTLWYFFSFYAFIGEGQMG
jgi:hypothetical protein